MNLAIIPARGGSKRIPRKNILDFLGKPIIAYSIEAAISCDLFDEVMVSTDDQEIAEVARKFGATAPFMRSKENSDDFSGPGDVALEVIRYYEKAGKNFDTCCCIYATAPLIQATRLIEGYNLIQNSKFDTVYPVAKFNSPIWRSYKIENNGQLLFNFPENEKKRSQDLPDTFHDAGQFYWFKIPQFLQLNNKNVFGNIKGAIVLDDLEVQDIDNMNDWELAELKAGFITKK